MTLTLCSKRLVQVAMVGSLMQLLLCVPVAAKCHRIPITIRGEVSGDLPEGALIEVHVSPDPKYKISPSQPSGGQFEVEVLFDTFKSRSWLGRERCSRKPESLAVAIVAQGKELDRKVLAFPNDFEEMQEGHFATKAKVVFQFGRERTARLPHQQVVLTPLR